MQKKYFGAALSLGLVLLFTVQLSQAQVKYTISTLAGTGSAGYSGDGSPASGSQLNSPSGVTVDGAGNIYIGDAGNNVLRVISGGIIHTYAGNGSAGYAGDGGQATKAKLSNPVGLCTDLSGNVDVADEYNGRIRQISTSSFINTIAGNGKASFSGDGGPATNAQLFVPIGVVKDASGNIYIADSWNHRIRMINTSGVISTFAGNGVNGYGGDGGPATKASLSFPNGVAVDGSGNVYIADAGNNRIRKVVAGVISTVAGNGFGWYGGDGGQATATELNNPTGIFVDPSGNMYIADKNNSRVRKVTSAGIISTIAGNGTSGFAGDAGPATSAELNNPTSVTMATSGVLYIADNGNQRIRQLSGGNITTYAGNGTAGNTGDGAGATAAEINNPFGVSLDGSGNLYIGDASNNKVRKVSFSGIITTFAGNGTSGYSGDGGQATLAKLNYSSGVFADATGNIYIVDELNGRVRYVNTSGVINLVAGNGVFSFSGDGGPADSAQLFFPIGIATDYSGNSYIADCFNHRIRKVSPSGVITTFAGNGTGGFAGDGGPATNAELLFPIGVAADPLGNVYIADASNNRIRKVNSSGTITTFAGNGTAAYLGDGGQATAAELNGPTDVMVDLAGNIVITDKGNSVIRSVAPSGVISTIAGNGIAGFGGDYGPATGASAELNNPWGTAEDNNGNIYITDYKNNRLRMLKPNCTDSLSVAFTSPTCVGGSDGTASVTVSTGTKPYTYSWAPGGQTTSNITGLSAAQYTITVTDAGGCNGNYILTMPPHPYKIGTIMGHPRSFVYGGDGGPALSASGIPVATAFDKKGNIYVADAGTSRVRIIKPNGIIQTIAGNGTSGYSGDGGPATAAELNGPTGLAFDNSGNLYIADEQNNVVRKLDPTGKITTFAGNGTQGYTGDTGPATNAELYYPAQLITDAAGNVYICDYDNNAIRKVDITGTITTIVGGNYGFAGDGGPATNAKLKGPQDVVMDSKGNLYITDYQNNRIRMVNTSGIINTFAGTGTAGFTGEGGPATNAEINQPTGIGIDGEGNIYFADFFNSRIRVIDRGGNIHTIAGNGTSGYAGDGGLATAAQIYGGGVFEGLSVDANYNIYISGSAQGDIRKLYACDCNLAGTPVVTQVACYGMSNGAATIAAASSDPPFNYYWVHKSDTTTTISGLPPGIDTILVKDANNCWLWDSVIIPQDPKITVTFAGPTSICSGATAAIGANISNPKSYAWSTGATTNSISVTPTSTTTYSVLATDINGCSLDSSEVVTVVPYHPTIGLSADTVCPGSLVTFSAGATSASYLWSNGATTQSINVYPTSQQTYSVTVDSMTCKGTSSLTVDIYGSGTPQITGPDSVCPNDIVTLIASGGGTYLWSTGATTSSITFTPTMDSNYYVIITSGTCSDSVKHQIIMGTTGTNCALHIYNGFTPNGDGHNDEWIIDHIELFPGNDVQIFNRWGTRVWIASNYDNVKTVWKGLDGQGQPLPDATYYYVLHVNNKTYKGWVQLTR